jgi:hypothetical protein
MRMAEEDQAPGGFVRLLVPLEREPGGEGPDDEWLWAEPLGSNRFRLESTPFFAYGLSYGDVVRAGDEPEMPRLTEVERKCGHRTLRIALDAEWNVDHPAVQKFLGELLEFGCSYEPMPPQLVALDVPPEVDVAKVIARLQAQVRERVLVWEWADPRPS